MNNNRGTSVRFVLCIAAVALGHLAFAARVLAGEAARPVASMSLQDRQRLPDNTMVKLKSGRTATLGVLRAEHQARMARFSRAAALGRMAAGRLSKPLPVSTEPNRAATQKIQSATGPGTKSNGTNKAPVGPAITEASRSIARPFYSVPFQIANTPLAPVPKDYMDFCKAAEATACIYLPADTTLTAFQGDPTTSTSYAWDEDALITDAGVCKFDGGLVWGGGCLFYYPVIHVVDFKPTGTLSTAAACDAPSKYLLDAKGAIKASYPYPSVTFTTGGAPITCVAQVWISR